MDPVNSINFTPPELTQVGDYYIDGNGAKLLESPGVGLETNWAYHQRMSSLRGIDEKRRIATAMLGNMEPLSDNDVDGLLSPLIQASSEWIEKVLSGRVINLFSKADNMRGIVDSPDYISLNKDMEAGKIAYNDPRFQSLRANIHQNAITNLAEAGVPEDIRKVVYDWDVDMFRRMPPKDRANYLTYLADMDRASGGYGNELWQLIDAIAKDSTKDYAGRAVSASMIPYLAYSHNGYASQKGRIRDTGNAFIATMGSVSREALDMHKDVVDAALGAQMSPSSGLEWIAPRAKFTYQGILWDSSEYSGPETSFQNYREALNETYGSAIASSFEDYCRSWLTQRMQRGLADAGNDPGLRRRIVQGASEDLMSHLTDMWMVVPGWGGGEYPDNPIDRRYMLVPTVPLSPRSYHMLSAEGLHPQIQYANIDYAAFLDATLLPESAEMRRTGEAPKRTDPTGGLMIMAPLAEDIPGHVVRGFDALNAFDRFMSSNSFLYRSGIAARNTKSRRIGLVPTLVATRLGASDPDFPTRSLDRRGSFSIPADMQEDWSKGLYFSRGPRNADGGYTPENSLIQDPSIEGLRRYLANSPNSWAASRFEELTKEGASIETLTRFATLTSGNLQWFQTPDGAKSVLKARVTNYGDPRAQHWQPVYDSKGKPFERNNKDMSDIMRATIGSRGTLLNEVLEPLRHVDPSTIRGRLTSDELRSIIEQERRTLDSPFQYNP